MTSSAAVARILGNNNNFESPGQVKRNFVEHRMPTNVGNNTSSRYLAPSQQGKRVEFRPSF